uniref:Uncharacterized protein n=1 Tax=Davidia involucrata TaxID=16924 RepID=A0A5B7BBY9_DAVIN
MRTYCQENFGQHLKANHVALIPRFGQSQQLRTRIASQWRLITITWYKNLLLHGLCVSVHGPDGDNHSCYKVELKTRDVFSRKQGAKHFIVDGKPVHAVWDLKAAKFNGETKPQTAGID